jgi:peroxiredoxin
MAYTLSLGDKAPNFSLPATDSKTYSLEDFQESDVLVLFFTCNHCPYVIGSDETTRKTVEKFQSQSVRFVGINSNSQETRPEDSFESMVARMKEFNFPWTYLHDESQKIAELFGALKTPHFFVFNKERSLVYCGRAIDNPRDSSLATTNELEKALEELLSNKEISTPLTNPIGCNIKWKGKPGKWMPAEACDLV